MQKSFGLEIKGVIYVVFRTGQFRGVLVKYIAKNVPGPYMFYVIPNRLEYTVNEFVWDEPLPV
jgi:hypothetical protein